MTSGIEPQISTPYNPQPAPGSQFQIMPATWRDLGALRNLEQVCFPKDAWPLWDLIGVLTLPNMVRLKAVIGDDMVGFVAGDHRPSQKVSWIATICVLPEYRRLGIGEALLQACEAELPHQPVRLCVRVSNNAAQEMYRKMNYSVYDIWEKYYQDGEDALVMQKILNPGRNGL